MTRPRAVRNVPDVPAPRYYTVDHPRLWGGEHPCPGGDVRVHSARLATLLDAGVTTFVDLTEHGRENGVTPYGCRVRGVRRHGLSVAYFNFPVTDTNPPRSRAQAEDILDVIDAALANDETVYVHCKSGVGRTGTILGLHLVRQGCRPTKAVQNLKAAWQRDSRSAHWPLCPQTEGQRRYILDTTP